MQAYAVCRPLEAAVDHHAAETNGFALFYTFRANVGGRIEIGGFVAERRGSEQARTDQGEERDQRKDEALVLRFHDLSVNFCAAASASRMERQQERHRTSVPKKVSA
ncbi:hypothetical protein TomMM35A_09450 [Sphingobium sp. TomMM35A]